METIDPVLAEHPFSQGLTLPHLEALTECAVRINYAPGEFLCREDQQADLFFLIYEGRVAVEIFSARRGPVTIQTLGPGEVLGWLWFLKPYHWHLDARAAELTRVLGLKVSCLHGKCDANHDLGYEVMKRYAHSLAVAFRVSRLQLMDMYAA